MRCGAEPLRALTSPSLSVHRSIAEERSEDAEEEQEEEEEEDEAEGNAAESSGSE